MVIRFLEVNISGPIAQPTWVGCAMLVLAVSARCLMTCKAECFTIGRCISTAATYCSAVVRLPCSTLSLVVVFEHELFSATLAFAVGVVKNLAFCFLGKSHVVIAFARGFWWPTIQEHSLWSGAVVQLSHADSRMRAKVRNLLK